MSQLFTPSGRDLEAMIERAMRKCDGDIEQTKLKADAKAERRLERSMLAEAAQRRRRFWQ